MLVALAVTWDLTRRRIPNSIPLALAVLGIGASFWLRPVESALYFSMGGLLTGFGVWLIPYALRITGGADVKLAAALGAWLGAAGIFRASIYAALAGGLLAIIWLLRQRGLLAGYVRLKMMASGHVGVGSDPDLNATTVPYALALAAGAAVELASLGFLGG